MPEQSSPELRSRLDRLRGHLLPALPPVSRTERLTAAGTAFLAILLLAGASYYFAGRELAPFMVASMGASAVLLFAAPHSPLAHPWSFVGGHLISAVAGVACTRFIPDVVVASAAAVATAILVMHSARCLHPPGGATALVAVLGGDAVRAAGFGFVVAPVAVNVAILLAAALLINNLTPGRRYPLRHVPAAPAPPPGWPLGRGGLARADLEAALKEIDAFIDVDESDLEQIYARATLYSHRRRLGEVRCADIMTRELVTAEYGDELGAVWVRMQQHKVKGVPVIDRARRVIGIVTIVDFMKQAGPCESERFFQRLCKLIRRTPEITSEKPEVVGQIMTAPAVTARDDAHIVRLVPLFAEHDIHHVPIVNAENRLVGIVTQSDLVAALYSLRAVLS